MKIGFLHLLKTKTRFISYLSLLLLFILTLIYLYPFVLHPQSIQDGYDLVSYYYPYWLYIKNCFNKYNELPLWNTSILCGTTIIGNAHFSFYYPPNWLFLVIPINIAFNIWFVLHLFLAGIGCYLFLKNLKLPVFASIYGALIFMFGGHFAVRLNMGHYDMVSAYAWIPFTFLFLQKLLDKTDIKNTLFFGLFLGCQLMTLHLQIIYLTLISLAIYTIVLLILKVKREGWSKSNPFKFSAAALISGSIAVALCSAQLLYILQAVSHSHRIGRSYEIFSKLSLPPKQIIGFFVPDLWGSTTKYTGAMNYWELSAFIGFSSIIPILFSFIQKNRILRTIQVTGFIALLFAICKYTFFGKILYSMPYMSYSRVPARFLIITVFSLAVSAAFGINHLINPPGAQQRKNNMRGFFIILAVFTFFILLLWLSSCYNWFLIKGLLYPANVPLRINIDKLMSSSLEKISLVTGALWLFYILFKLKKIKLSRLSLFLSALTFLELFAYNQPLISMIKEADLLYGYENMKIFSSDGMGKYRIWGGEFRDQVGFMKNDLEKADGYEPLIENNYFIINNSIEKNIRLPKQRLTFYRLNLLRAINVKYLILRRKYNMPTDKWEAAVRIKIKNRNYWIYRCREFLPRAFFSDTVYPGNSTDEFYKFINGEQFKTSVFADYELAAGVGRFIEARIIDYQPNQVNIRCENKRRGLLILSDVYFPGWKAWINGRMTNIIKSNFAFRGVQLEPGNNIVEFRYEPVLWNIGRKISLLTLGILIISFGYLILRREK